MTYTRVNWADTPSTSTPLDAANLNVMDIGISNAYVQGTGTLVNADIASGAAIAKAKLANLDILNADVDAAAAIAISKLADPGSGKVITSAGSGAVAAFPPGYQLIAPVTFSAPITVSGTVHSSPTDIVSSGAFTYDGTPIVITMYAPGATVGTTYLQSSLWDGSTELFSWFYQTAGSISHFGQIIVTPSAGSHTYKWRAYVDASTGQISAGNATAGNLANGYIRVTKA